MKAISQLHSAFRMHRFIGLYAVLCILSVVTVIFSSCKTKEEPVMEKPLTLTLSADSVYCVPAFKDLAVLKLSWTSGSNRGTGSGIAYTIEVAKAGKNFTDGFQWEIGRTADRTLAIGHKTLADSLRLAFPDMKAETYELLEWRVKATVLQTGEKQVSNVVKLAAKWNENVITDLYMNIGGDDVENSMPLTIDMDHYSTFTWAGFFTEKCAFKLLLSDKDTFPCYVAEGTEGAQYAKLHYCESLSDYTNNLWNILAPGYYTLTVDVKALTMSIKGELFLIGDATPNDWDLQKATFMQPDETDFYSFSWSGFLKAGEFKLLPARTGFLPCFVRDTNDPSKMVYSDSYDNDTKWEVTTPGMYTIKANIKALTIDTNIVAAQKRAHVYLIGSAAPNGWSWDNIPQMSNRELNIFTWQGFLNAGELKFPTELKSDWSGEMIFAPTPNCEPSENGSFEIRTGGDDNKWLISTPGEYQIQINFDDTTISFVKL